MSTVDLKTCANPYPGLRPFLDLEEHLFFGRERQVDAMADKLCQTHFLAVVGTSGSGKSSLVNCGLRPALHRGLIATAGSAWRVAQFRPGNAPIRALAQALAAKGVLYDSMPSGPFSADEMVEASLRMSSLGLLDAFEQAQLGDGVNLLVVADQFEELFRYRSVAAGDRTALQRFTEESAAFVNLLLAVAENPAASVYVVLTMRSDFLGDCAQFTGLPEAINQSQYLVPRMTRDERRRAIEGPALMQSVQIAPVLLTRLVNDVGDLPDQLSLLQHALNRTWTRWQSETQGIGPIELCHYEAVGSMAQALDQHAEEAFARLSTVRLRLLGEKVFKALTDRGTDARGVRRPTRLASLCALADASEEEVRTVIDVFRAPDCCFLMPPAAEALAPDTVIDISHESLMRVWKRLRVWSDEESRCVANLRRLAQTAALFADGKSGRLRDPELQMALNWRDSQKPNASWAAQYGEPLDAVMKFLDASKATRTAKRVAILATMAVVFLGLTGTLGYFVRSEQQIRTANSELEKAIKGLNEAKQKAEAETQKADQEKQNAEKRLRDLKELQAKFDELMARNATGAIIAAERPKPVAAGRPAEVRILTATELGQIIPDLPTEERKKWTEKLNLAMAEFGITTARRQAAFLAQVSHETGQFRYLVESWGPTPQQLRYEPPSTLAASLGNVKPGDGERYRGRGLIWITGRENYEVFGKAVKVDLVANPDLAATPEFAARTAAWFWKSRGLNELADQDDLKTITRRINGGFNGLDDRMRIYQRAKSVLGG